LLSIIKAVDFAFKWTHKQQNLVALFTNFLEKIR